MTAATMEKVYRLDDRRVRASAGSVLAYIAYRAYYEDGRCAWPSIETIAAACFIDERTVRRAIDQLIELDYLRVSEDQSWNVRDAETGQLKRRSYRSTVYDVLTENFRSVEAVDAERRRDRERCRAGVGESVVDVPDSRPVKMSGLENGPDSSADNLSAQTGQNVHQLTSDKQLPLPPTGVSPHGGTPTRDGEEDSKPGEQTDQEREDVTVVLEALHESRLRHGLVMRAPTRRDRRALASLIDRLAADGELDPVGLLCHRIIPQTATERPYWQARIDSGRRLARYFDELRNDNLVDQRNPRKQSEGRGGVTVRDCTTQGHAADCDHVLTVSESDWARSRCPSQSARRAFNDRLARLADEGADMQTLADALAAWMDERDHEAREAQQAREAEHARIREEVRRAREANGGSMFRPNPGRAGGAS